MTLLARIQQIAQGFLKYGALATAAVAQVQSEVGSSGGDPTVQQTKKQLAVMYVLAAAHAGESVPIAQVQQISAVIELVASSAKALGLFGKQTAKAAPVEVPPASVLVNGGGVPLLPNVPKG
jgi:hypothetical protein